MGGSGSGVYPVCVSCLMGLQVAEAVDVLRGAGISEATDRLMTSGNYNPQSPRQCWLHGYLQWLGAVLAKRE